MRYWQQIASDLVEDAREAGFEVKVVDTKYHRNPLLDHTWYVLATADEVNRLYEWGQP